MRGCYGPEQLAPLQAHREDRRITTSNLLPEMLALKAQKLNYREIGERLNFTKRAVEHVFARHRKNRDKSGAEGPSTLPHLRPIK